MREIDSQIEKEKELAGDEDTTTSKEKLCQI